MGLRLGADWTLILNYNCKSIRSRSFGCADILGGRCLCEVSHYPIKLVFDQPFSPLLEACFEEDDIDIDSLDLHPVLVLLHLSGYRPSSYYKHPRCLWS